MTTIDYDRVERACEAGYTAVDRYWEKTSPGETLVDFERSRDLWTKAFIAEIGPEAGLPAENVGRAWESAHDRTDDGARSPEWMPRFAAELGLVFSAPAAGNNIDPSQEPR